MKRCPACNREYPDDYAFCLEDATDLVPNTADSVTPVSAMEGSQATIAATSRQLPPKLILAVCVLMGIGAFFVHHRSAATAADDRHAAVAVMVPTPASASEAPHMDVSDQESEKASMDSTLAASTSTASSPTNGSIPDLLVKRTLLTGEAGDTRRHVKWLFRLRATEYDASTGRMAGELEWTTMGSLHRVEGKLEGSTLTFKETAFLRRGRAVLGPEYRLTENDEHNLTGKWQQASHGTGGYVWCAEAVSEAKQVSAPLITAPVPESTLTEADLAGKSKWDLILLRNEPYARHGYRFHEARLFHYFAQQPWYHPDTGGEDKVYRRFSATEKRNVEVLRGYQSRRGLNLK